MTANQDDHQRPDEADDPVTVLIVEDTRLLLTMCDKWLERHGYRSLSAVSAAAAEAVLAQHRVDVVLLDIGLPDANGLDLMAEIKAMDETCQVIVMTAQATIENAVAAMRHGAADFVTKPVDFDLLEKSLRIALRARRLGHENRSLRAQVDAAPGLAGIIGQAPAMQSLLKLVEKVAPSEETCLIVGENGTGKEVVARAVHRLSERAQGPFVPVNCGAISEGLIESELFGHVKGAFSGADHARQGVFRQAEGGTLLLDEIGDMALAMQVKLLRALESREVTPVGSDQRVPIDIRILAATNVDLVEAVKRGSFREDLYYRLNVVQLSLPPLRERSSDIAILARHVLRDQTPPVRISSEALAILERWTWPGNVRELQNALRRACVLCEDEIRPEHLPPRLVEGSSSSAIASAASADPRVSASGIPTLAELERVNVEQALEVFGGDRGRTAKALGIDRVTLYRKLKRWGLDPG